jgi:hypothetical protein
MAQRTKSRPVTKAPPSHRRGVPASRCATVIDRTTEGSADVLKWVEAGRHYTIEAVCKFVGSVDRRTLPHRGEGPSRRQELVDSGMELSDRLVATEHDVIFRLVDTQHDLIRKVLDGTAKAPAHLLNDLRVVSKRRRVSSPPNTSNHAA